MPVTAAVEAGGVVVSDDCAIAGTPNIKTEAATARKLALVVLIISVLPLP
jgi:hypothetical protein